MRFGIARSRLWPQTAAKIGPAGAMRLRYDNLNAALTQRGTFAQAAFRAQLIAGRALPDRLDLAGSAVDIGENALRL
jgi:hypothetical protein